MAAQGEAQAVAVQGPVEVARAVLEGVLEAPVEAARQEVQDQLEEARLEAGDREALQVALLVQAEELS